jgi:hypothetical protein
MPVESADRCYVCLGEEEPLLSSVCACCTARVHAGCLERLVLHSGKLTCGVCTHRLRVQVRCERVLNRRWARGTIAEAPAHGVILFTLLTTERKSGLLFALEMLLLGLHCLLAIVQQLILMKRHGPPVRLVPVAVRPL